MQDVASVLRRFIRSLDEPLLTGAKRARWLETASTCARASYTISFGQLKLLSPAAYSRAYYTLVLVSFFSGSKFYLLAK